MAKNKKKKKQPQQQKKKQQDGEFFNNEEFMKLFAFLLMLNMLATAYLLLDNFGYSLF